MSVKNILCLGDIIGITGRYAIRRHLEEIKLEHDIDFVIANGENAANGIGITRDTAAELFNSGVNVLTSGNHIWNNRDVFALIGFENRLLRPYNYPNESPGLGYYIYDIFDCKNPEKHKIENYDFRIFNDIDDMVCAIKEHNSRMGLCRTVAGYAWEWKTKQCYKCYYRFSC